MDRITVDAVKEAFAKLVLRPARQEFFDFELRWTGAATGHQTILAGCCGMGSLIAASGATKEEMKDIRESDHPIERAAERLGLPRPYAVGFAEGWDGLPKGAYERFSDPSDDDQHARGYTDGVAAYKAVAQY